MSNNNTIYVYTLKLLHLDTTAPSAHLYYTAQWSFHESIIWHNFVLSSHNENRDIFRRLVLFARGVITSLRFISLVIREYDQRFARNCSVYIIYLMYIIGHRWYTAAHARISPEDISVSVHPVINHRRGILKENNPPKQWVWACALCVCVCAVPSFFRLLYAYTHVVRDVYYIPGKAVYTIPERVVVTLMVIGVYARCTRIRVW